MNDIHPIVIARWQKILSLQDWEINVEIKPYSELKKLGETSIDAHARVANVSLMRVEDAPFVQNLLYKYDLLETFVHEIVHIHLRGWKVEDPESIEYEEMEWAVNAITRGLRKLYSETGDTD